MSPVRIIGMSCLLKTRQPKRYRVRELDALLRQGRTRMEARLLHKAKVAGVRCPTVLEVTEFSITMGRLKGRRPIMDKVQCAEAGRMLALLHAADIMHGDFTPANLIWDGEALHVIDFGLGSISGDIEDKAMDVFTMLKAIADDAGKAKFVEGYCAYDKARPVLSRVKDVEGRVRYAT